MRHRPLLFFFFFVSLVCIIQYLRGSLDLPPCPFEDRETVILEGTIHNLELTQDGVRLILNRLGTVPGETEDPPVLFQKSTAILVYPDEQAKLQIGNRIRVQGTARPFEEASNPGQFDQKAYQASRGLSFQIQEARTEVLEESVSFLKQGLFVIRRALYTAAKGLGDQETAGVVAAMVLGERSLMAQETKNLYKSGGISHILAISGLHISMIGMALYRLLRRAFGGFWLPAAVGVLLMSVYGKFTGAGASTQRAVIMFVFYLGAQVSGREYDRPTALAAAGAWILLRSPIQLFQCGFQLSMLSVAGLLFFEEEQQRKRRRGRNQKKTMGKRIWETFGPGLFIQAFTLPATLYWFSEIPVYGSFLNLLVLPLMPAVLLSGAGGMLLACVWPGGGSFLFAPAYYILHLYEGLCRLCQELPFFKLVCGAPSPATLGIYYGALALFFVCRFGWKKGKEILEKGGLLTGAAAAALALGAMFYPAFTNGGSPGETALCFLFGKNAPLRVTFLDVGQGDCAVIRAPSGFTCMIDGGSSSKTQVGTYRILPFLKNRGIGRLDLLILTHMDADHINGAEEILADQKNGIPVGRLLMSETSLAGERGSRLAKTALKNGTKVSAVCRGQVLKAGDLALTCLWPYPGGFSEDENQNSLVFRLEYGDFSALFTGDLEGEAEAAFLDTGISGGAVQILKAGHHGSKGATSDAFLDAVRPFLAVLSYGEGNRYGHPSPVTLLRLKNHGVSWIGTGERGAVTAKTDGTKMWIFPYLAEAGKPPS